MVALHSQEYDPLRRVVSRSSHILNLKLLVTRRNLLTEGQETVLPANAALLLGAPNLVIVVLHIEAILSIGAVHRHHVIGGTLIARGVLIIWPLEKVLQCLLLVAGTGVLLISLLPQAILVGLLRGLTRVQARNSILNTGFNWDIGADLSVRNANGRSRCGGRYSPQHALKCGVRCLRQRKLRFVATIQHKTHKSRLLNVEIE